MISSRDNAKKAELLQRLDEEVGKNVKKLEKQISQVESGNLASDEPTVQGYLETEFRFLSKAWREREAIIDKHISLDGLYSEDKHCFTSTKCFQADTAIAEIELLSFFRDRIAEAHDHHVCLQRVYQGQSSTTTQTELDQCSEFLRAAQFELAEMVADSRMRCERIETGVEEISDCLIFLEHQAYENRMRERFNSYMTSLKSQFCVKHANILAEITRNTAGHGEHDESLSPETTSRSEPQIIQRWHAIQLAEEFECLLTDLKISSSIDSENGRVLALEVDDLFIQELEEGAICVPVGSPETDVENPSLHLWDYLDDSTFTNIKPDWQTQYEADFLFTSTPNIPKLEDHLESQAKKILSARGTDSVSAAVALASTLEDEDDDVPRECLKNPELDDRRQLVRRRKYIRTLSESSTSPTLAGDVFNRHEVTSFVKLRYVSFRRIRAKLLKQLNFIRLMESHLENEKKRAETLEVDDGVEKLLFVQQSSEDTQELSGSHKESSSDAQVQPSSINDLRELDLHILRLCADLLARSKGEKGTDLSFDRAQILHDAYKHVSLVLETKVDLLRLYKSLLQQPMTVSVRKQWHTVVERFMFYSPIACRAVDDPYFVESFRNIICAMSTLGTLLRALIDECNAIVQSPMAPKSRYALCPVISQNKSGQAALRMKRWPAAFAEMFLELHDIITSKIEFLVDHLKHRRSLRRFSTNVEPVILKLALETWNIQWFQDFPQGRKYPSLPISDITHNLFEDVVRDTAVEALKTTAKASRVIESLNAKATYVEVLIEHLHHRSYSMADAVMDPWPTSGGFRLVENALKTAHDITANWKTLVLEKKQDVSLRALQDCLSIQTIKNTFLKLISDLCASVDLADILERLHRNTITDAYIHIRHWAGEVKEFILEITDERVESIADILNGRVCLRLIDALTILDLICLMTNLSCHVEENPTLKTSFEIPITAQKERTSLFFETRGKVIPIYRILTTCELVDLLTCPTASSELASRGIYLKNADQGMNLLDLPMYLDIQRHLILICQLCQATGELLQSGLNAYLRKIWSSITTDALYFGNPANMHRFNEYLKIRRNFLEQKLHVILLIVMHRFLIAGKTREAQHVRRVLQVFFELCPQRKPHFRGLGAAWTRAFGLLGRLLFSMPPQCQQIISAVTWQIENSMEEVFQYVSLEATSPETILLCETENVQILYQLYMCKLTMMKSLSFRDLFSKQAAIKSYLRKYQEIMSDDIFSADPACEGEKEEQESTTPEFVKTENHEDDSESNEAFELMMAPHASTRQHTQHLQQVKLYLRLFMTHRLLKRIKDCTAQPEYTKAGITIEKPTGKGDLMPFSTWHRDGAYAQSLQNFIGRLQRLEICGIHESAKPEDTGILIEELKEQATQLAEASRVFIKDTSTWQHQQLVALYHFGVQRSHTFQSGIKERESLIRQLHSQIGQMNENIERDIRIYAALEVSELTLKLRGLENRLHKQQEDKDIKTEEIRYCIRREYESLVSELSNQVHKLKARFQEFKLSLTQDATEMISGLKIAKTKETLRLIDKCFGSQTRQKIEENGEVKNIVDREEKLIDLREEISELKQVLSKLKSMYVLKDSTSKIVFAKKLEHQNQKHNKLEQTAYSAYKELEERERFWRKKFLRMEKSDDAATLSSSGGGGGKLGSGEKSFTGGLDDAVTPAAAQEIALLKAQLKLREEELARYKQALLETISERNQSSADADEKDPSERGRQRLADDWKTALAASNIKRERMEDIPEDFAAAVKGSPGVRPKNENTGYSHRSANVRRRPAR